MEYNEKSTKPTWIFCALFLIFKVDGLDVYYNEACYSNLADGFLKPSCPQGQVIYPFDVYTYSKQRSTGCMAISGLVQGDPHVCCRYVNETEDCGMRYYGQESPALEHYRKFTGENSAALQVAWNNTLYVCNQTEYYHRTHYMRLGYNCINTSQSGSTCNSSLTGNQVFLWNDGYPNSDGGCGSDSGCSCTIQSTGGSSIQIDAFDLRFSVNETTGKCAQRIFLSDGGLETDIACDDVNLFERRTLYTSVTDSVYLRYDNTYDGSGGNFWISIQAFDSSQSLTVSCGQVTSNVDYSCGENFTIISPETTTTQTTESETTVATMLSTENIESRTTETSTKFTGSTVTILPSTGSASVDESTGEESTASKGPIIGAIIGVVLGLIIVGLVAYGLWRRHRARYKVNPDDDLLDLFNQDNAITSRPPETYRPFSP